MMFACRCKRQHRRYAAQFNGLSNMHALRNVSVTICVEQAAPKATAKAATEAPPKVDRYHPFSLVHRHAVLLGSQERIFVCVVESSASTVEWPRSATDAAKWW